MRSRFARCRASRRSARSSVSTVRSVSVHRRRPGVADRTNTGPLAALAPPLPPSELIPLEPGLFLERNPYMRVSTPILFSDIKDGRARYLRQTRVARRVE